MTAPQWSTACPDWESRIVEGRSLIPFAPLFPAEAAAARDVFGDLRIVDAPHSPTFGEVGRPWLFEFSDAIFGAYDPDSGRRLIREFFLLISKKNAKSTGAAAIMLTALMRNWRKSGEFSILAPTIEIANNSFFPARDMVREDAELHDICHVQEHYRTITHKVTGATLKVVAADDETVGGKKSIGVLVDELWLFGKRANAENMLREATGGRAARPEGFTIYLSTQADDPPAGVFKKKLQYARAVRDGRIKNNRFLPVLYEFPKAMIDDDRCRDKRLWHVTNPNLGASVDEEFLSDEYDQAVEGGSDSVRGFLAKHLNIEIGMNLRSDRWPGADFWKQSADETITFEELLRRCEVIVVGLDGGGLDDLYGFAALGRERAEIEIDAVENGQKVRKRVKRWLAWCHAWCHRGVLERRKSIATMLEQFEDAEELTIVDDALDDVAQIIEKVQAVKDAGLLHCVAVDPAGLGEMIDALAAIDVTQENKSLESDFVIGVPQGYAAMNAIKTVERKLANGTLRHADQSIMDWAVGNVKIEPTATAIRATKQNAGDAKIDPWAALIDAAQILSMNPAAGGRSVYSEIAELAEAAPKQEAIERGRLPVVARRDIDEERFWDGSA